jgi:DNA polymerase
LAWWTKLIVWKQSGALGQPEANMPARTKELEVTAADFLPNRRDLASLEKAAADCRGCSLFKDATQAVFGEGPKSAPVMLVGEQPGDEEDKQGRPFVGPAGRMLDKLLGEAGIDRDEVFVTNAVKHFKFEWRGKRRLHKKPRQVEIVACRPWLESELAAVAPDVLVCLGATAAQAVLGPKVRVTKDRGTILESDFCDQVIVTYHPSALLRIRDDPSYERQRQELLDDLKLARKAARKANRRIGS